MAIFMYWKGDPYRAEPPIGRFRAELTRIEETIDPDYGFLREIGCTFELDTVDDYGHVHEVTAWFDVMGGLSPTSALAGFLQDWQDVDYAAFPYPCFCLDILIGRPALVRVTQEANQWGELSAQIASIRPWPGQNIPTFSDEFWAANSCLAIEGRPARTSAVPK
jgi:hypothetical protein